MIESANIGEILTYKPSRLQIRVLKVHNSQSITGEILNGKFKDLKATMLFKNLERENEEDFLL